MLFFIGFYFFFIRIYSYLFSPVPLGYDPGLYLYLFKSYTQVPLLGYTSLPDWVISMYPPLLPVVVKLTTFWATPESILVPLILLASLSLFFSVYIVARKLYDAKSAISAVTLLSLSVIQYKLYWYYYLKNIFAIALLLWLILAYRAKSKWAWILTPALILLHQPTAILAVVVIFVPLYHKMWSRFHIVTALSALSAFFLYYVPNFDRTIMPFLPSFIRGVMPAAESGTFMDIVPSLVYMSLYIVFAGFSYFHKKIVRVPEIWILFFISLLQASGMFLSRRFIPYIDIFAILLAAPVLARLKTHLRYIVLAILLVSNIYFVYTQSEALILTDEFEEIKLLQTTEPDSYILVADNEYTPWVYGYSERRSITPGFGQYDVYWNYDQWNQFWLSNNRDVEKELLDKLPTPLYIYLGDRQRKIQFKPEGACFTRFSWHVYKYTCNETN